MSIVALYVPGSRPDRFDRAAATGAEVILDLEDAVALEERPQARAAVAAWVATHGGPVQVRVNAPGTEAGAADVAALPAGVPLRVPKVEHPDQLAPLAGHPLHVLVESAAGVEGALDLARAASVVSIGLGEADLAAELGVSSERAFDWIRSRIVVAAAAAGLPAPMMSAYPDLRDLAGLEASCRHGRELGMRGRTAVHPAQVVVIRRAFAPTDRELAWADEVLRALGAASGVATLADGSMVDAAMARRARSILGT